MLRSLFAGISGLRAHQTMLDVTGNNIANVNTAGFKSSSTQFQDTLSQVLNGAGAGGDNLGGTNPAQVGLGVAVAGISTSFVQGPAQSTGRPTDQMISGDGFFIVRSGNEQLLSRAGSFDFDKQGRLVNADGLLVQGWVANGGTIDPLAPTQDISIPIDAISPAVQTTTANIGGNLPDDAELGSVLVRDIDVFDDAGNKTTLSLTLTRTATGWDVGDGATVSGNLTYAAGALTSGAVVNVGGIDIDFSATTGYAAANTVSVTGQDGRSVGSLESHSIGPDGTIYGTFSNGVTEPLARIALGVVINPGGLEKAGGSTYRLTPNSGDLRLGTAGDPGFGILNGGYLEGSNVDLSQEFTNLIIAQRGFQANARVITTSDQTLQELVDLKR